MPVMPKAKHEKLEKELRTRFESLMAQFRSRELVGATEGAGKGRWKFPEQMCGTVGLPMDLRLAVEDFKAILAEVKALK